MRRIRRASFRSHQAAGFLPIPTLAMVLFAVVLSACAEPDQAALMAPEVEAAAAMQAAGQAAKSTFTAQLAGANEVPPADSRARGNAVFQVSADGSEVSYRLNVANIENVTQAHIHIGVEGVTGPVVVWLYPSSPPAQLIPGRSSGPLATGVITQSSLVGQWAGQPLSTLIDAMRSGAVYVNVHTSQYPPGEVRGQIR
jgi:hypothetical protein